LNIYSTNNIPERKSFSFIVVESFKGITLKLWQYLENTINKDFEDTLVIHVEKDPSEIKTAELFTSNFILSSKSELVDFYQISGVKHLAIVNSKDLMNNMTDGFYCALNRHIRNPGAIWAELSVCKLLENKTDCFNILNERITDFKDLFTFLNKGLAKDAAFELGFLYQLRGRVVYGNNLGQKLGYPTANVYIDDSRKKVPANGVYAALVCIDQKWYKSMINIGVRPTINKNDLTIEAHIFDFSKDVYGKNISIHFTERLRDEVRFPSLELLKNQIAKDENIALAALEKIETRVDIKNEYCFIR